MVDTRKLPGAREPIAVVGAGYVGLTTAAVFASRGHEVWCIDSDPVRIDGLRRGRVPISERGLSEMIVANMDRLHFEIAVGPGPALEHVRLVFVAVGTPYDDEGGGADLSRVDCVIDSMPASDMHAVVMKSTVPPGTGTMLQSQLEGRGIAYVSCPEFLQEGKALEQFGAPDRVVIGSLTGSWAGDAVEELHRSLDVGAWLRTDVTSAEMIKLTNNLHLAMRVSFINEVGNMCEELGADVEQVATGVGLDERIGPSFLSAGLGFGGSCLIKDVKALAHAARERGYASYLPEAVLAVNGRQLDRVVAKLERDCGGLSDRLIAVLGIAFKPDTDDIRGSTSLALVARLRSLGARVRVAETSEAPIEKALRDNEIGETEAAADAYAAVTGADACVIATEWDEWRRLDWQLIAERMQGSVVIDGRNGLDPRTVEEAGLLYRGTGRLSEPLSVQADPAES